MIIFNIFYGKNNHKDTMVEKRKDLCAFVVVLYAGVCEEKGLIRQCMCW
jgi:hypothetical protein